MALQIDHRIPAMRAIVAGSATAADSDLAIARYWQ
jgi:hypothetical protein